MSKEAKKVEEKAAPAAPVEKVVQVRRAPGSERGWELVELTIQGDKVLSRKVKAGPDVRRIMLSLAFAELTRN